MLWNNLKFNEAESLFQMSDLEKWHIFNVLLAKNEPYLNMRSSVAKSIQLEKMEILKRK